MSVEEEIARTKLRLAALERKKAAAGDDSDSDIECIEVGQNITNKGSQNLYFR